MNSDQSNRVSDQRALESRLNALNLTSKDRAKVRARIMATFNDKPPYSEAELNPAYLEAGRSADPCLELDGYSWKLLTPCVPIDFIEVESHDEAYGVFVATNSKGSYVSATYSGAWRRALCNL